MTAAEPRRLKLDDLDHDELLELVRGAIHVGQHDLWWAHYVVLAARAHAAMEAEHAADYAAIAAQTSYLSLLRAKGTSHRALANADDARKKAERSAARRRAAHERLTKAQDAAYETHMRWLEFRR